MLPERLVFDSDHICINEKANPLRELQATTLLHRLQKSKSGMR
jgi:hypothetical protein